MQIRTTVWMQDGHGGITVLAYGPASLLDVMGLQADRQTASWGTGGRMLWLRGVSIDRCFDLMRQAVSEGTMRLHPSYEEAVEMGVCSELERNLVREN